MQFNQDNNGFGTRWAVLGLVTVMLTSACGDGAGDDMGGQGPLEVIGAWDDNFGGSLTIDADLWGTAGIHDYDNEANWAVTRNAADDMWSPNTFNYVVWTEPDGNNAWWTCTVGFGLETMEEAMAAEDTSDDSDPANSGCGGFAWTGMMPGGS